MTKDIINVTSVVEKIRKEIKLCDEVGDNSKKMKEQIKELEEKDKENNKEKKLKEKKKKVRRYER